MSAATISALMELLEAVIQDTPEAIALFNSVKAMLEGGTEPTPEQWADLDTKLAAAHASLQGA